MDVIPDSPKLELGMLLYPGFTMLDLIGPQTVLSMHSNSHFISHNMEPVPADSGGELLPTATFETARKDFDILFVPGGFGTEPAMRDPATLDFLRDRGQRAKYITSVCSGSLVLAAAGLLNGYKSACHWALYSALEEFAEVEAVRQRVVTDRNRVTGGGVTAGVDFGLTLLAELRGEHVARLTQLMIEYDPAPPFDSGYPDRAGADLTAQAIAAMGSVLSDTLATAKQANSLMLQAAA